MGENGKEQAVADSKGHRHEFTKAQEVIHYALEQWGYPFEVYELLREPLRTLTVRIPVKMDDGRTEVFTGYRVQHNDAVGPALGGVRFHPEVMEDDVKSAAIWASLQSGLVDIPYGGASGAIVCNPTKLSFRELEALSRGYIRAIIPSIGSTKDVITPDAVTNTQVMAWMLDEYSQFSALDPSGFMTGKPVLGGSLGREVALAKGAAIIAKEAAKQENIQLKNGRVVIHGFGNVGTYVAKELVEQGVKIVGVSDGYGALHDEDGLDVDYLLDRRDSFGMVTNLFKNSISKEQLLGVDCDLIIDASRDRVMTPKTVKSIKADLLVETGKRTISEEASAQLHEQGTTVIPHVLTSAGNKVLSYLEGVQNHQGYYWMEEEVNEKLQQIMENALSVVYEHSRKRKMDMQQAAYMIGIHKHAESCRLRGWI
ncbi:glutamate dehydrogenase [Geomicrobium halophilum]|uniref:Glutamate dehydrogenase n=1 Tax=Geomicrobium halophilum TaxID=549000 RepID=A0A841PJV5_9BACL|nr:Glu/Leu/Phe/Val dehydrogenase [Geomicrobium halophilum]MBB6449009.1 glutamate dehydrogenase [Geomicrobium halophilum]